MNHHLEAWEHVKKHLFGTVCEVVRRKPWGFKEDREDIITKTVDEFLKEDAKYGTVILHILSGEGEPKERILKVQKKAEENACKVVILEHNPDKWEVPKVDFGKGIHENWGRNILYAYSSLGLLELNELSDYYVAEHIDKVYVNKDDHGICKNNMIYTHTSERPINFELPKDEIVWVIGGGLAYESMEEGTTNILIDSVLRQCLFAAKLYGTEPWKIDRIYQFKEISEEKDKWLPHWRKPKINGVKPKVILHKSLSQITEAKNVYVSTVEKKHWYHIKSNILEAVSEPRDIVKYESLRCNAPLHHH